MLSSIKSYIKLNYWAVLGFFFKYLAPLLAFGFFVTFFQKKNGIYLTVWAWICLAIAGIILLSKLKSKVKTWKPSIKRWLCLSVYTVGFWVILFFGLFYLKKTTTMLLEFWGLAGTLMLIGCGCYLMDETKKINEEKEDGQEEI